MTLDTLHQHLQNSESSLLVYDGKDIHAFKGRGVSDLYRLLTDTPETLSGAMIADKVIGKGAAALMILGQVREVYTDIISSAALKLFEGQDIKVCFSREVPYIINQNGNGMCPVETLCQDCASAAECLPLIKRFVENGSSHQNDSH